MPAVRGAQGPPDKDDIPFHHPYRRPMPHQPAFCHECFELQPDHQVKDCPSYGRCCFCDSDVHKSVLCIAPHVRCNENECIVPSWHHHHGSYCSADAIGRLTRLMNTNPGVFLLRALRPDVGGWVTLSPRYWTGVPSDGGRAPYSAVLGEDLSWSSKLARCLSRQCKRT